MNRIVRSFIIGVALALVILFGVKVVFAGEIGISTGPTNLAYYATGTDIKNACPQLPINIYESKGGLSNIGNMFTRPEIGYAFTPLDTMAFKDRTDHGKMSKITVLLPLYKNVIQVVANNKSGIKTVRDLNGKRVNRGPVGSGSWVSSNLVEILLGIKFKDSAYSTTESLQKVMSGELDAAFYFSGVPTPDLVKLGKDGEGIIHLVNMSDPKLEAFKYYEPTEIPENTYAWEQKAVQVIQTQNYLVAYNYSSQEKQNDASMLLECILSKLDWLAENGNPVWKSVDKNAVVKWPLHPKAVELLKLK
jgi:uncharacterized protein